MIKYLSVFLFLFSALFAKENFHLYPQLANPLFESIKPISKLSKFDGLDKTCNNYQAHAKEVLAFSKELSSDDKASVKEYLQRLRKLQKEYEYTLFIINKNIEASIDKDNYKKFLNLTDCNLDGLLKSRVLLDKSIKYYKKNRAKKRSKYFEEKISFAKLLKTYQEMVYNQSVSDTFSSSNTIKTTNSRVYIQAEEKKNYIVIYIVNNNPYTITMSLDTKYEELDYDIKKPKSIVIKSKSKIEYIRLYPRLKPYSYSLSFRWIIGSKDAEHDETYLYKLPYESESSYRVSQGFNGKTSHFGRSKYAVDFAMNIGTKIHAARGGKVVRIKSNSNKGGMEKKFSRFANYINIEHKDGTIGMYYHLKKDGVIVKVGDMVTRGQHIAYSGNTGYSSGPHLHFGVFKASTSKRTQTVPIKFISSEGIVESPKKGKYYKSKG